MKDNKPWPVMVLAHNEEETITSCLDSIIGAESDHALEIYVMANGCTDQTEDLVKVFSTCHPEVKLISIGLGDKCNAWNEFIHNVVPASCADRDIYFFMDGDARVVAGSFSAMANALSTDIDAHAASAVPASGRSMAADKKEILEAHGLVANLYALRGSFVERLRSKRVHLPLKLEGDDGLLGALIKWDLSPPRPWDHGLIHPCAEAAFEFDPVPMTKFNEWPKYWRRLVRYGRRYFEFELLRRRLHQAGLAGLPQDIQELYHDTKHLRVSWRGVYTFPFLIALWEMRKIGKKRRTPPDR